MVKSSPNKLKIYAGPSPEAVRSQIESVGSLPEVLQAFRQATGWSLRYVADAERGGSAGATWSAAVDAGAETTPGQLVLEPPGSEPAVAGPSPADSQTARMLASSLAGLLGELVQTRHALWQREAELAAGVPLVPHAEEEKHLAARLQAVLRGGAEAVGCHGAALYLLDEATTELKLRCCWGLPFDRLTAPARRLQGAVADLEALLGHAVVLEDHDMMAHWKGPEDFPSAVCVPVSTPTTLLGTLWVFCDQPRQFNDGQTNVLEVVAGRLAADLEREMLLREGIEGAQMKRQLAAAERLQRNQLPAIAPLVDGWQVAGWTAQAESLGGDFYDWFCPGDGLLAVAVGHAMDRGIEAALAAGAVKASLRSHARYHRQAERALRQINLTLWTASAGDQHASLFLGLIETATGRVCSAAAGQLGVVRLRSDGWDSLSQASPQLGESPEADFEQLGFELPPGDVLVLFTAGVRDALDEQGRPLGEAGVAESLLGKLDLPAEAMAGIVRDRLAAKAATDRQDQTVLVVKRTKP